jgi:hypothetical protein
VDSWLAANRLHSQLTEITISGAPLTIWNNFKMKPEGTALPPSLLGAGEPSRLVSSAFTVAKPILALLFFGMRWMPAKISLVREDCFSSTSLSRYFFDPNEEGIGMKKSVVAFPFANSTLNNPHPAVSNG